MKKTYNRILKIFLWIGLLYISFMLIGCENGTGPEKLNDQYLFVEYKVLESWRDGLLIAIDGPIYLFNDGVLDLKFTFPKPEIDRKTKLLIGKCHEIAPESWGGGEVGSVKALKDNRSTDTLPSVYFKNIVEIIDCDNNGAITFKLNDQLFKLKPGETYTKTFTVESFVDNNGRRYNFFTSVVSIKHSGFIDKDKVIGL